MNQNRDSCRHSQSSAAILANTALFVLELIAHGAALVLMLSATVLAVIALCSPTEAGLFNALKFW